MENKCICFNYLVRYYKLYLYTLNIINAMSIEDLLIIFTYFRYYRKKDNA